jgi:TonB family protein
VSSTNNAVNTAPVSAGDSKPAVLHEVLPDVSRRARNSISGTVKVKVKVAVDPTGKVTHSTLAARGPSAYFAKQALQAAHQWTFVAPQVHGQPAGSEWALSFEFRKSGTRASAQRVS